ncbi:MAG: HEPN domain-containing protein [Phycisphaerae bacterium]|nr:HEPN domain-containing protein [Phycisphaerae bacterium]
MNPEAMDLWERAKKALHTAGSNLVIDDSDASASRAYYAAFYAVSALFALEGKTFKKHSAVQAAVHRDLVKPGLWREHLGEGYTQLMKLRYTGDYGVGQHIMPEDAEEAVTTAAKILRAIAEAQPEIFTGLEKN